MTQTRPAELERFSDRVLSGRAVLETPSPFERQIRWELMDRAGSSHTVDLRSGMTLSLSRVRWERRWTLAFDPDPSKLKFIVSRGPGPRVTARGGEAHDLSSGSAHVSRIRRQVELRFDFAEATSEHAHEELCLEVGREQLCQLVGSHELPAVVERVWASAENYPFEMLSAPPASFRLLDEMLHCEARGAARQLHLEAKGLELLAAWVDQLEDEREATATLSAHDIQRLERARSILLSRMTSPPLLPELARLAGLNEAKLKAGFRSHFGDTVYGVLRRHRLAAIPNGALSALAYLRHMAKLRAGEHVLVYGASGSVGTAAVQLAKAFGARVTGVCSTKNVALVESLGADAVIDYTARDFRESTTRYDIVFDTAGRTTLKDAKSLLKPRGRYLVTVFGFRDCLRMLWTRLTGGQRMIGGASNFYWKSSDLELFCSLSAEGRWRSVVDRTYPWLEAVEAHRYVEAGHKCGSVVLTISHDSVS